MRVAYTKTIFCLGYDQSYVGVKVRVWRIRCNDFTLRLKRFWCVTRFTYDELQYNTIQYKTYNAPYVTKMLFVGAGMTRD